MTEGDGEGIKRKTVASASLSKGYECGEKVCHRVQESAMTKATVAPAKGQVHVGRSRERTGSTRLEPRRTTEPKTQCQHSASKHHGDYFEGKREDLRAK